MQLRLPAAALLWWLASLPALAGAQGPSWSGAVEARGNYYWEASTRVVAPEVRAELQAPFGLRVRGRYLVDAITSASQAAGVRVDVRFTEVRHDAGLGVGYELDLGRAQLDLTASGRVSSEPDYLSAGGAIGAALSLAERATVLGLDLAYTHDTVGKILRGANRMGTDGRDLSDRGTVGSLDGVSLTATWDQVLARDLTLQVGYGLGLVHGLQSNPYRTVGIDGVLLDERHPDARTRHTGLLRLAYYLRPTGTALHALYRAYVDSWQLGALTPEGRVYQHLGEDVMVRLRYRYYVQTRASFQRERYGPGDAYYTADPKMAAFESHLAGALLLVRLRFLEDSALDFAFRATLEVGLELVESSSRYGDGVIGQVGVRVPF